MTILIIYSNNKSELALSLESIRHFNDFQDVDVVVVDNGSEVPAFEAGEVPSDISYIYMDEGAQPVGKLINLAINALSVTDDILIMSSPYCVAPNTLNSLFETMASDSKCAVAGGMAPSFGSYQHLFQNFNSYSEFLEYSPSKEFSDNTISISTDSAVILVSAGAFKKLNGFCESLSTPESIFKDFCLRAFLEGLYSIVTRKAVFWTPDSTNYRLLQSHDSLASDMARLETIWGTHYFNICANLNMVEAIDRNKNEAFSVLEIGCDCGATLLEIKNRYPNCKIYGTDISLPAIRIAEQFSHAAVNNIEDCNIPFSDTFDYILFGDVLEHLRDPESALKYCKSILNENGKIIANIPNLMHISVIEQLLNGNFTYSEKGLLDKTHIHFFTYNEIIRLFEKNKLHIDNISAYTPSGLSNNQSALIDSLLSLADGGHRFMYETFQYLVIASNDK